MELLTWNIQAARGVDGINDTQRIAHVIQDMGNPDVICLQEVACHLPVVDAGRGEDQVNSLAALFPNHDAFYGAAIDCIGPNNTRMRFGNLILSRFPVTQTSLHQLPRPLDPENKNMPRQATEVIVRDGSSWIRVMTTHLEYHSALQRKAQVRYLGEFLNEAHSRAKAQSVIANTGPYEVVRETGSSVLCGDFNLEPTDPVYHTLTSTDSTNGELVDAWPALHGSSQHAPTCGLFDKEQWPEGPHCRDFFFLTPNLASRIELFEVNPSTDASDHQPIRLILK
ncbi:MAG: endonuclease/exonuclease/phosphatase family protein [Arenicellales bacterium]|nr:endonuclease/exonuclease/phosphatase family protein [Arenicellales bacterium]